MWFVDRNTAMSRIPVPQIQCLLQVRLSQMSVSPNPYEKVDRVYKSVYLVLCVSVCKLTILLEEFINTRGNRKTWEELEGKRSWGRNNVKLVFMYEILKKLNQTSEPFSPFFRLFSFLSFHEEGFSAHVIVRALRNIC